MIEVKGKLTLDVHFIVEVDMTEEQWDLLSERNKNEIIDGMIGIEELESAEMNDCDIWDVTEIKEEPTNG